MLNTHEDLPSTEGYTNNRVRLASGLTFPEELLLLSLRPRLTRSGHQKVVAKKSVKRTLVLLALVDLMLVGRIRLAGSPNEKSLDQTRFGDAGAPPDEGTLAEFQAELTGLKTIEMWIVEHRKQVSRLTAWSLAARGLVMVNGKAHPTLTEAGAALGRELREGYTEILRGGLEAPRAESLWLITCDHARLPSKVFREADQRVVLHGGFEQVDPRWQEATPAVHDIETLFRVLGIVPPFDPQG